MEFHSLRHLQKREWVLMMHFIRWFVRFGKTKREGKSIIEKEELVEVLIVASDVNYSKGYNYNNLKLFLD